MMRGGQYRCDHGKKSKASKSRNSVITPRTAVKQMATGGCPLSLARSQKVTAEKAKKANHRSVVTKAGGRNASPLHLTKGLRAHMRMTKATAKHSAPMAKMKVSRRSLARANCALDSESARIDPVQLKSA